MTVSLVVGWVVLIMSWFATYIFKDKQTGRFVGTVLSALATGIFIGGILEKYL